MTYTCCFLHLVSTPVNSFFLQLPFPLFSHLFPFLPSPLPLLSSLSYLPLPLLSFSSPPSPFLSSLFFPSPPLSLPLLPFPLPLPSLYLSSLPLPLPFPLPLLVTYFPSFSLLLMVWKSIGCFTTLKYSGNFLFPTGSKNGQASSWRSSSLSITRQSAMLSLTDKRL